MSDYEKSFSSLMLQAIARIVQQRGLTTTQVLERLLFLESPAGVDTLTQVAELSLGLKSSSTGVDLSSVAAAPAAVAVKILNLLGSVRIPFAGRFAASEHFVVNTKASAVAKVSYLSDNFKEWFMTKVEGGPGVSNFSYCELLKNSVDAPILAALREQFGEGKEETTLAAIWHLMCQQKNGEAGVLLTNGYTNIFYVLDGNGVLRTVSVGWNGDGWNVYAYAVTYPDGWYAGDRVFSQNS